MAKLIQWIKRFLEKPVECKHWWIELDVEYQQATDMDTTVACLFATPVECKHCKEVRWFAHNDWHAIYTAQWKAARNEKQTAKAS
jgi:hypothetical protein